MYGGDTNLTVPQSALIYLTQTTVALSEGSGTRVCYDPQESFLEFWDRVSLVALAVLELTEIHVSQLLGLQTCATTPGYQTSLFFFFVL